MSLAWSSVFVLSSSGLRELMIPLRMQTGDECAGPNERDLGHGRLYRLLNDAPNSWCQDVLDTPDYVVDNLNRVCRRCPDSGGSVWKSEL